MATTQMDAIKHLTPGARERLKRNFPHGTFSGYRTFGLPLTDLRAQLQSRSGVCHRFGIQSLTSGRVVVEYSNPDEYGSESPVYVTFPVLVGRDSDERQMIVQYTILRCTGGRNAHDRDAAAQAIDGIWWRTIDDGTAWIDRRLDRMD